MGENPIGKSENRVTHSNVWGKGCPGRLWILVRSKGFVFPPKGNTKIPGYSTLERK